jgi:hypothetical protein
MKGIFAAIVKKRHLFILGHDPFFLPPPAQAPEPFLLV